MAIAILTSTETGADSLIDINANFAELNTLKGVGDALVANPLSQFAQTTSLQLKNTISDETGSGALVFGTSPALTTPTGIVKNDVGLGSVDNTTDAGKPVSTAQQTALNLKSNLISPAFTTPNIGVATGSVSGNAGSATILQTARTIAGVSFNGSANIAIASTNLSDTASIALLTSTQTLTNKRITARVLSATSYTTNTGSSINADSQDMFIVTAQAGALLFNAPSGTHTDGQKLIITVASSTTVARALTWNASYGATTTALPTTTAATTATLTIGFIWSTSKSLWQCVAVA